MDCIKHGKAKQTLQSTKKKIHRLLFYSSIFVYSRDLFSLSFFGRNKKSFSIPKRFVCFSFLSSLKLKHKGVERKSIKLQLKVSDDKNSRPQNVKQWILWLLIVAPEGSRICFFLNSASSPVRSQPMFKPIQYVFHRVFKLYKEFVLNLPWLIRSTIIVYPGKIYWFDTFTPQFACEKQPSSVALELVDAT